MYFPKPAINENDLAIIERGDTAEHSIEAGQYVSWKGKLGKSVSAILQGATLDDSLFSYDTDGVINELNNNNNSGSEILYNGSIPSNGNNIALSDSIENYNGGIVIKLKADAYGLGTLFIPKALIVYDTANTDYNVWEVPVFQGGAYGWLSCKIYDATHIHIHNKGNGGWGAPTNITVVGIH